MGEVADPEGFDRRRFLRRAGGVGLVAGTAGWTVPLITGSSVAQAAAGTAPPSTTTTAVTRNTGTTTTTTTPGGGGGTTTTTQPGGGGGTTTTTSPGGTTSTTEAGGTTSTTEAPPGGTTSTTEILGDTIENPPSGRPPTVEGSTQNRGSSGLPGVLAHTGSDLERLSTIGGLAVTIGSAIVVAANRAELAPAKAAPAKAAPADRVDDDPSGH